MTESQTLLLPVGRPLGRRLLHTFQGPSESRHVLLGGRTLDLPDELWDAYTAIWKSPSHQPKIDEALTQRLRDLGLAIALPDADPAQGLMTVADLTWVSTGWGWGNGPVTLDTYQVSVTPNTEPIGLSLPEFLFWESGFDGATISETAQALSKRDLREDDINAAIWHLIGQGFGILGCLDFPAPNHRG